MLRSRMQLSVRASHKRARRSATWYQTDRPERLGCKWSITTCGLCSGYSSAEGRFFAGIAKQVEYVWDLDDTRGGTGGVRYDGQGLVLTPEGMLPLAPARFEESLEHPA